MQILGTAQYLGDNANSCAANHIWVSLTQYTEVNLPNCSLHSHVNPHLTLLLQGGTLEKRQKRAYERMAGDIVFFHAGEPHQNSQTLIPSKNINLEFEPRFFEEYGVAEADLHTAVHQHADTKFLLLKAYQELRAKDSFSADSMTMVVLDLVKKGRWSAENWFPRPG